MPSVSQKMELKIHKLGIIAGDGDIPKKIIDECIKLNIEFVFMPIEGHGTNLSKDYEPDFVVNLSKIGKAIKFAKSKDVKEIIMIGGIERPSLKNMFPDIWTAKFLAKISSKISGDNSILASLAIELEREGFKVLSPEYILPNLLCPKGILGKNHPNEDNKNDIKFGFEIAKKIGECDIGQSLVIQSGLVLAVEAAEGTDEMIMRSSNIKIEQKGGVFIKVLKPNQDIRMDRPVIGINTIKKVHDAGLDGLAIEANSIFFIDYDSIINYADKNNLFIIGV